MTVCVLCKDEINFDDHQSYSRLTEKGCLGINKSTKLRKLDVPDLIFDSNIDMYVHMSCRARHCNLKAISIDFKKGKTCETEKK